MSAKALVTGGSGFIGGRLIESLVADGHEVRAVARSQASADTVAARGAEPVRGELGYAPSRTREEGLAGLRETAG